MKRSTILGAALLGAMMVPMAAQADEWRRGGEGHGGWHGHEGRGYEGRGYDGRGYEGREYGWGGPRLFFRPAYPPPPVYYVPPVYAPPPVYYAPPPVVYQPQPYYPAPVYVAPSINLGVSIPLR